MHSADNWSSIKIFSRKHAPFQIFTPTSVLNDAFTSHDTHEIIFMGIGISYLCWVQVRPLLMLHHTSEIVTHVSYYPCRDLAGCPLLDLLPGQQITPVRGFSTVPNFGSISLCIKVPENWAFSLIIIHVAVFSYPKRFRSISPLNASALKLSLYHKQ